MGQIDGWAERFLAVWPDGSESEQDLHGELVAVGETLPGFPGIEIELWETVEDAGELCVVGHLRRV